MEARGVLEVTESVHDGEDGTGCALGSGDFFRPLVESMRYGVVYHGANGAIIYANPAAERILGLSVEQMQGRKSTDPRWKAIHEDGSPFPGDTHPAMVALRTGQPVEGVLMGVYNPVTDETTWIDVTAVPLFQPGRDLPSRVYATFQDITERRNAEAARRKSDERLRLHYELGLVGLAVTSPDKGWLQVNERLCQMLGYTRQELMATTWVELTHADDRALDLEQFERVLAGEIDAYRLDKRFVRQDGSIVHVDLSVKCLRRPDGSVEEFVGLIDDITERRLREESRRSLEAQFHQSQKMESLGGLASGVAHELNNVLAAILSLATAHRSQVIDAAPLAKCLDTITVACTRGRDVVRSLLQFSRVDLDAEHPVDLNSTVREVEHLLSHTTLQRARLRLDLDPALPLIRGDAGLLTHSLVNLCLNAVEAMPEGGDVLLATRRLPEGGVEVAVCDTGRGMSPEIIAKAAEPFFSTKPRGSGTGLGLSLVYGAVRAHDGALEIQSQVGLGTEVTLRFPPSREETGPPPRGAVGAAEPPRSLRILLIDDDDLVRESVSTLLEILGHDVHAASGGLAALRMLEDGLDVDVVILDMSMPGMSGAQALPRLRAVRPGVPILLASGNVSSEVDDLRAAHPGVHTISKPFSMGDMRSRLASICQPPQPAGP